jgi:hypothetical protein
MRTLNLTICVLVKSRIHYITSRLWRVANIADIQEEQAAETGHLDPEETHLYMGR